MAQLTPDRSSDLTSVDTALTFIIDAVPRIADTERVALVEADGRILARDVVCGIDLPPFDNSAVDGYAVAAEDVARGEGLSVSTRIVAGSEIAADLEPHTAARIFTGARLPRGADTIFMQEDVREVAGRIFLPAGLKPGENVRLRGEDLRTGACAVTAGRRLRPQDLALVAGLGVQELDVRRRPKVAVFSTGDEIVDAGGRLRTSQRFDSNRVMMASLLKRAGAQVRDLGILKDDQAALQKALGQAADVHDMIITTGGVSVGEEDHVKAAVAARGEIGLWRLAIKPGRPIAFGRVGTTPFLGLPGNPVAAFVTFVSIVRPVLAAMTGEVLHRLVLNLPADFAYRKKMGRREYVRARLEQASDGTWKASKHAREGAAVLTSLTSTDGLVELPEDVTAIEPGDTVAFSPYETL